MTPPRRKRVSDEVLSRIRNALQDIASDDRAPRTKREIERRTGLSHDAVARAFRQESEEDSPFALVTLYDQLLADGAGRSSPHARDQHQERQKARDLQDRLTEAEGLLKAYAMALYAYHLQDQPVEVHDSPATPIGRNRQRR